MDSGFPMVPMKCPLQVWRIHVLGIQRPQWRNQTTELSQALQAYDTALPSVQSARLQSRIERCDEASAEYILNL